MQQELLPHLFRTEYRNIVSVLCHLFGIEHIELAEDIVSDTFLTATEQWGMNGLPPNPVAWLYTVAKNKTRNHLKRDQVFQCKISKEIGYSSELTETVEIDLSPRNIADSQLAMIFTICNPCITADAQVSLALNLLCGFGVQEVADAFLTNRDTVYKRMSRARERLKQEGITIQPPTLHEINDRLDTVLTTVYLLFSEGYYSTSQNTTLRKDLCKEAMRLNLLLIDNPATNKPAANALFALMCFHASRFEARANENGEIILYQDQDETLWDRALIEQGAYFLNKASVGDTVSKFHLEAGIAYWHTRKEDTMEKWENILDLYNLLLIKEYSPIAALNRTFALSKARGKETAIPEAEKLGLTNDRFYYSLLGYLYTGIDNDRAREYYNTALYLTSSEPARATICAHIRAL